jgi:hypothetical protein
MRVIRRDPPGGPRAAPRPSAGAACRRACSQRLISSYTGWSSRKRGSPPAGSTWVADQKAGGRPVAAALTPAGIDRRIDPVPGGRREHQVKGAPGGRPGLKVRGDDLSTGEPGEIGPAGGGQVGAQFHAGEPEPASRERNRRHAGGAADLQQPVARPTAAGWIASAAGPRAGSARRRARPDSRAWPGGSAAPPS